MDDLPPELICKIADSLDDRCVRLFSSVGKRYRQALSLRIWRRPKFCMEFPDILTNLVDYPIHHLETENFAIVVLDPFLKIKSLRVLELNHGFGDVTIQDLEGMEGYNFKLILHSKTLGNTNLANLGVILRKLDAELHIDHCKWRRRFWNLRELPKLAGVNIKTIFASSLCVNKNEKDFIQVMEMLKPREIVLRRFGCCLFWLKEKDLMRLRGSIVSLSTIYLRETIPPSFSFSNFKNMKQFYLLGRSVIDIRWLRMTRFCNVYIFMDTYWNIIHKTICGAGEEIIDYLINKYLRQCYGDHYVVKNPLCLNFDKSFKPKGFIINV